ncbi:MAG: DUF1275 family protein [Ferrovum sp. 37-45-19]|jgi:uncharacterized membrane protein YoaK (UPF0700 family)|uniref:YoaK family protein n=1 Tax=Ferrovum sp. JA12 TaxID=1356299 RepID=UPI0007035F39|nr:YoaK family protein [Ferrovum sp. JA12]OYV78761.1 MAG: DUF1275 family protein [Ferrovum sp. 21-44-67]OYV93933.1 MAG: DUF1275 family protein [Ferrovum sp. 37-45-19]OZB31999.1 MAG: DUF1275 family protein [Ferrovum sp. 34-44-207]HQT81991.1 YoaK family protein [Ferrovaceae bacterium]KRH78974.1 hypothetical protein FERRO_00350 [Ferrovum sp. JA12]
MFTKSTAINTSSLDKRDILLSLMATASSATDVIAFLTLQKVFTSAMTGNTALLGIALGSGDFVAAVNSFIALIGYLTGVALAALIKLNQKTHELILTLVLEAMFLLINLVMVVLFHKPSTGITLHLMIAFSAMAMGIQSISARKVSIEGISTVVFTSTLTSIVVALMQSRHRVHRQESLFSAKRQVITFAVYAVSALVTGLLIELNIALYSFIPFLAIVLCVMYILFHHKSRV